MGSCCRSLWRSWPLFPDSRQGCWLRSIHRGLGISSSGPFSGMLKVSGDLRCYLPLTIQVTRSHKPLQYNLCIRIVLNLERGVCVKWYVLFCFPGIQNKPEWHLIDRLFMTHSLEMRRRPATFRRPTLRRPAALTSPTELIIFWALRLLVSGESKERPSMQGNKLWL